MNIGLDFDGVISNVADLKRRTAMDLFGIDIPEEKFHYDIIISEGILTLSQYHLLQTESYNNKKSGLLVYPVLDSVKYINKLKEDGHVVSIITARGDRDSLVIAKEWMEIHKVDLPIYGVGTGNSKKEVARKLNLDVFVDDHLQILEDLVDVIPNLFLFSWKYNEHINEKLLIKRVDSWSDFYNKINKLGI